MLTLLARARLKFIPSSGDVWGGLVAMLVALPASIAFGVTVYSAIGADYASHGAVAGIIGAVCLGLIASTLGGTDRLISTPCAPAAAVLSAFALQMSQNGDPASLIIPLIIITGILAGLTQLTLGLVGIGRLIKYIPYPVVSGYLTGVGLIIIGSQIPKLLGIDGNAVWWESLSKTNAWDWRAIAIALITITVAILGPRFTRRVPATILAILAGTLLYLGLAFHDPALRSTTDNPLIVGALNISDDGFFSALLYHWQEISRIDLSHIMRIFGTALTLGVLLSIDTLKTCVILDQLTHSRHNSNRELVAQGVANVVANACGGMSGAGQMGATLIGLNSGSTSRLAGVMEGLFALVAALLLSALIAWIPVATLAGILILIGVRMIDRKPLQFLRSRTTILDFFVVLAVVVVALTIGLMAASGVGVTIAILLFVRKQIGNTVIRHKLELWQTSSTWHRPEEEQAILEKKGDQAVIFELQGSLFFGNTYNLYTDLEKEILTRQYVIIDMRRVQSVDITAAHLFNNIRDTIRERGTKLLLSGILQRDTSKRKLHTFLSNTGLWHPNSKTVRIFPDLDAAIAWVEDRLLGEAEYVPDFETPIALRDIPLFANYKEETLKDLESCMEIRSFAAGETLYSRGTLGDELYWVRRGAVRLVATLPDGKQKPLASFARGDFFGGLAFMDQKLRPNDAIAFAPTEVYVLTRERFDEVAARHKKLALNLTSVIARTLAMRLRRSEKVLTFLQEM